MSTTAFAPNNVELKGNINLMPQKKTTRQIVREEIKRAQDLEKLEAKYEAGEISEFEYKAQKFMLNLPEYIEQTKPKPIYSTTA